MQTIGRRPARARPAAKVTACCSQMPTSKKRSGNSFAKLSSPVEDAMAAVIATTSGWREAADITASANTPVYVSSELRGRPVRGSVWALTWWRRSVASSMAGG